MQNPDGRSPSRALRWIGAVTSALGSLPAIVVAFAVVIVWLASGPFFHFSDAWQLWINTASTISTGLMVFVIQNSQNRETRAMNTKLDALIVANPDAANALAGIEDMAEADIKERQDEVRATAV